MADLNINWDELKDALVTNLKQVVKDDLPQIKEYAERIAAEERDTLQELTALHMQGLLTDQELASEIADEKVTVRNQLLALKEMSTAAAQKATNAAIEVLQDFALKASKALL